MIKIILLPIYLILATLSICSIAMSEVSCMNYYEDQDYKTRGFTGDIKASSCHYVSGIEILDIESFIFPSFVENSELEKISEEVFALKVKGKTYEEVNLIISNKYGFYLPDVVGLDLLLSVIYNYVKPNASSNLECKTIHKCSLLKQKSNSGGFSYIAISEVGRATAKDVLVEQALNINQSKKYYRVTYFDSTKPVYLENVEFICKRKEPWWVAHEIWLESL
ncbi:hypothetical protein [Pseudoalteromonas sp. S16_S37]|uniref:hypothetical protein n=1 Tax=Pseudoalteromonas sp. S16_S37 TaxID=2720228 RepID=UPI001681777F|nr:hypothetical protein [Pseudoalteromonas sp. S16_S37]MBD1584035.1 hypothetical protein [Pseudoalteromonas sp. S16_S37]